MKLLETQNGCLHLFLFPIYTFLPGEDDSLLSDGSLRRTLPSSKYLSLLVNPSPKAVLGQGTAYYSSQQNKSPF